MENKELNKLIDFIEEISLQQGREWFRTAIQQRFLFDFISKINEEPISREVGLISEYCIGNVIEKQALHFYDNIHLESIKPRLISDYKRMEQFRREDNFFDFSLALFQQIEFIVNFLCEKDLIFASFIKGNFSLTTYKHFDKYTNLKRDYRLQELIFGLNVSEEIIKKNENTDVIRWEFKSKLKAVLFYYYFDKKVSGYKQFSQIYDELEKIVNARNLSHRGGHVYPGQLEKSHEIINNKYRNYFKFLGVFEDFLYTINQRTPHI